MTIQVFMPRLGESVEEATITRWYKSVGEQVDEFEPLLEVNTDKVDSELPSPASGTISEIFIEPGATVKVGVLLATIQAAESATRSSLTVTETTTLPSSAPESAGKSDLGFISPVVARIAAQNNIDLAKIQGTGMGKRITKKDILAYLSTHPDAASGVAEPGRDAVQMTSIEPGHLSTAQMPPAGSQSLPGSLTPGSGELMQLSSLRRSIAEHMVLSKRTSPHVTTVMEVDLSRVTAHRAANKDIFAGDGVNLTFTAYFISAAVSALKTYPIVNSSWTEQGIFLHRTINIGMATSLGEDGLIVPVIKNADSLSLLGLARLINDLASRARQRKLQPEEVKGGTFTLTNHGVSGSLFAMPIINQPQCAILGAGAIQKRVVVLSDPSAGDSIAIHPMAYLSLTFDHRILDGASADAFLAKVVESLQNWA